MMKKMNIVLTIAAIAIAVLIAVSCDNYLHDMMKPKDKGEPPLTAEQLLNQEAFGTPDPVFAPGSPIHVSTAADLQNAIKAAISSGGAGNYIVQVDAPITDAAVIALGNTQGVHVAIRGDKTITLDAATQDRLLTVAGGQEVILQGVTLKGHAGNNAPLVRVQNGGKFAMRSGEISGNTNTDSTANGGGVCVPDGTFEMSGGVYTARPFTMNDSASITGNTASGSATNVQGGGGYVQSTFTYNAGIISGNNATGSGVYGGGVYVNSGTFTMSGSASISGNTASATSGSDGGGVYANGSTFTMNDSASISNNSSSSPDAVGGGVHVRNAGTFTLNGSASVSNNTVNGSGTNAQGGGVYTARPFTMNDSASITGNTTSGSATNVQGGGGYVQSTFTYNAGIISGNNATTGWQIYKYTYSTVANLDTYLTSGQSTSGGTGEWDNDIP